ncbi:MAG: DUF2007 domain-containing protein [Alphaproteobacteria bacterium]|nr:DUF2007 domain-containing protein [Alphaproteobacteria bacterium]
MGDVRLYRADGPADAYLLRQWLTEHGIRCRVQGEDLMSLAGGIPVRDALPSVWVDAADEPAARDLLARWKGPSLVHPAWRCAACGEENPATFQVCWSCEAERDEG